MPGFDLLEVIKEFFRSLFLQDRASFGNRLSEIAHDMATISLPDFVATNTRATHALLYGVLFVLAFIYAIGASARYGLKPRDDSGQRIKHAQHPPAIIVAGFVFPIAAYGTIWLIEAVRQSILSISSNTNPGWSDAYKKVVMEDTGFWDYAFGRLCAGVVSRVLGWEMSIITHLVLWTVPAALIGYVTVHTKRGSWLFRLAMSIFFGFAVAYPLQIITMLVGGATVGNNFGAGFVFALLTALEPIIATVAFARFVNFSEIVGGYSNVEGKVDATPADDRPQTVVEAVGC